MSTRVDAAVEDVERALFQSPAEQDAALKRFTIAVCEMTPAEREEAVLRFDATLAQLDEMVQLEGMLKGRLS